MDIRLKILEDREKRIEKVREVLREEKKLVITIKSNICGNEKNIKETNVLLSYFISEVKRQFKVREYRKHYSYDGNYYIVVLENEKDEKHVKEELIKLENCKVGRLIDIDLYKDGFRSISRLELGFEKRKCLICNGDYNVCSKEKKHTVEEIIAKSKSIVQEFLIDEIKSIAKNSLMEEVEADPKFGLVTRKSSGRHENMDIDTFKKSILNLEKSIEQYLKEGFKIDKNSFKKLRVIGINAEKRMLEATNDVNTHKGAIFILGILLPSVLNTIYNGKEFEEIKNKVQMLTVDIFEDFKNIESKEKLTYGEKVYKKYGINGIRGETHRGLPIAFEGVEKFSNYEGNKNDLVINILLFVMERLDDTVILHRNDINMLEYVKDVGKEINKLGGYETDIGKKLTFKYTKKFIELNISPGGSADITMSILLLLKIKERFYKVE